MVHWWSTDKYIFVKNKDYKTFSYDQLLTFEKQGPTLVQKLLNQSDKKDTKIRDLKSKIDKIDEVIKNSVEKKIGVKPGSKLGSFFDKISNDYFGYYAGACIILGFLHLKINVNLPYVLSAMGGFIIIGPLILIGSTFALVVLETILKFLIGGDAPTKYQKKYDRLFEQIKKDKHTHIILSIEKKIGTIEKEKNQLDLERRHIEKTLYEIVTLKRKAKNKEDRAKIAAFNNKARSAASYVRANLLKEIQNKKNWECPYCHNKYDIASGNYAKLLDADHIHPVHKGGLSTKQNMILVCKNCNSKKKTLTLRQFCKIRNLDYEKTCNILEKMGKDV